MSGWYRTKDGGLIICERCGCPAPVDTLTLLQYESNFCPKCGHRKYKKIEGGESENVLFRSREHNPSDKG